MGYEDRLLKPRPTLLIPGTAPISRVFAAELRRLAWKQVEATFASPENIWNALLEEAARSGPRVDLDIEAALIDATSFGKVCESFRQASDHFNPIVLNAAAFESFAAGRTEVGLVPFFSYLAKTILIAKLRCCLELCCSNPFAGLQDGRDIDVFGTPKRQLNRDDVEAFIGKQIPHLRVVRDCLPWMVPYYMAHCSAKIMFAIDVHRSGYVDIDAILGSETFNELLLLHEQLAVDAVAAFPIGATVEIPEALTKDTGAPVDLLDGNFVVGTVVDFDGDGRTSDSQYQVAIGTDQTLITVSRDSLYVSANVEAFNSSQRYYDCMAGLHDDRQTNWFSMTNCVNVYLHFCALDRDSDGMLSKAELKRYNAGCFSDIVIDRVFDVHVLGNQNALMDYKAFLDFVVATEFPGLRSSIKYFWKILDVAETHEFIHLDVLRHFCNQIAQRLVEAQLLVVTGDSILSELVDMIDPALPDRITLEDIERCKQAATVLPVMLDFRCFFNYDSREQSLHRNNSSE